LQEYGHRVRLATHANFKTFVRSAGVNFYPLGGDPRVLAGCKRFLLIIYLVFNNLFIFWPTCTLFSLTVASPLLAALYRFTC